jgi:adenylate kinase family enzyme
VRRRDAAAVQRVSVVGCSGSGKSTLAHRLARQLAVPYVELDAVFHQPNWAELPRDEFRSRIAEVVAGDGWVVDGNYSAANDLVWDRADTVVWLDLPRPLVMRRVIGRTVRRVVTRQRLWNGNREPFANLYRFGTDENIIRWTWVKHPVYAQRYRAAMDDPAHAHLDFVRLRSPSDVDAFLA